MQRRKLDIFFLLSCLAMYLTKAAASLRCVPVMAERTQTAVVDPIMEGPSQERPLIINRDPTRSLSDLKCGNGCLIVLSSGAFIVVGLVVMIALHAYAKSSLRKDQERFARRETELRGALGRSPGFANFFMA